MLSLRKDCSRALHLISSRAKAYFGVPAPVPRERRRAVINAIHSLRSSEELFRAFVTTSSDAVYRMSPDWSEMTELQGKDFMADAKHPSRDWLAEYIHPADRDVVAETARAALLRKGIFDLEHRVLREDGSTGWVRSRAVPILDASGGVREWLGAASDITERKQTECALRQSEALYRNLFDSIDEGFCVLDLVFDEADKPIDYVFLEANPAFEKQSGLRDALGKTMRQLRPAHEESWYETFGNVALTGNAIRLQAEAKALNGWFDVYAFRLGGASSRKVAVMFTNIMERMETQQTLQDQSRSLIESARRKDEFLAMLSHELRNPLASITNAVRLLQLERSDDPRRIKAEGIIQRQAGQLGYLIDDLLEASRITTGKIRLNRQRVEVAGVVVRAVETVQPMVHGRGQQLTVEVPSSPICLHADAARLEQVFINLLANASKYTDAGGHLSLVVRLEGDDAVFVVTDDGVGIAPELLPRIFDLFAQADVSQARTQGGLGVGLCLVERLVELHGGTVRATSTVGVGSQFTVRLPVMERDASSLPASAAGPSATPAGRSLQVLVVDDNIDAAETLASLLELAGHQVRTVHDGLQVLDAALADPPDVVVLDIGLPGLNGHEVARRIRQEPRLRNTTLVALTGYARESERQRSDEAGFDHHLTKPANLEMLEKIMARA
jgi:signal transduction histidine kinase/CheY-like chemotaxis protein